ncbi:MAG: phosphoribosyltransferase domain protein [Myxococcaceae bacterium]|nr:phosphoribosyltransferase domain protein [Myxococcaceae bacterium]
MLQQVLAGLFDLLSPPACAACTAPLDERSQGFCEACRPLVERAEPDKSARDLDGCIYGGPLRDALHRFKYEGASELAKPLASWLAQPVHSLLGRVDLVAVVPLHPRRLRARGYNQSALLARPVARWLDVPFAPGLLRRARDTPPQVGLRWRERQAQLAGAFAVTRNVVGRAVLVVDDVRTTGATFDEARRALCQAEASEVFTLALARAPLGPEDSAGESL